MLLSASQMYGVLRSTSLCSLMIDGHPRILEMKEPWVQIRQLAYGKRIQPRPPQCPPLSDGCPLPLPPMAC